MTSVSSIPMNPSEIQRHLNTSVRENHSSRSELSLGITTNSASTRENTTITDKRTQSTLDNNISKYTLQDYVRKLMPKHRTSACMCARAHGKEDIEIHLNHDQSHAHYRNLMVCNNLWTCPVCAMRESSYRLQEISHATAMTQYKSIMVTYTLRHDRFARLSDTLEKLKRAHRNFKSGRKYQEFKANYGIVGTIKSLELTWGEENGWHPHIHELFFFDDNKAVYAMDESDATIEEWIKNDFTSVWLQRLENVGASGSFERSLHVRTGDDFTREYIEKHGKMPEKTSWTIEHELTKSNVKMGHGEHLTPFQLLERSKGDKNSKYAKLWFEYVDAIADTRQLVWSQGLKDLVGLEEITESMILELAEGEKELVATISFNEWISVCAMKKRADLLNIAIMSRGDKKRLRREIEKIHADHRLEINKNHSWRKIQLPDHIKRPEDL